METEKNKDISTIQKEQLTHQTPKGIIAQYTRIRAFSGPLPPPEYLEVYEKFAPGVTNRILAMAEKQCDTAVKQSDTRLKEESKAVDHAIRYKWGGLFAGFFIVLILLGIGTYVTLKGYTAVAIVLFTSTILGVPAIFVFGQVPSSKKKQ